MDVYGQVKKWDNAFVDMGASWIHGEEGNPITKLANTINAQVFFLLKVKNQLYMTLMEKKL